MSSESIPITPARFAEALKDLSLSSLHLKVLELRNSIAHLDYSNEQLRPYAEGREVPVSISQDSTPSQGQPDPDCVEAIKENEQVIERMQERIRLVRAEVENRGFSWSEFQSKEEADATAAAARAAAQAENETPATNGTTLNGVNGDHTNTDNDTTTGSNPWTDGTFQTGVIRNGQIIMDSVPGQTSTSAASRTGGSISDEELRRRMEEQLRSLDDGDEDAEGGLHL
ncbi:hypothetical protein V8F33_007320 [Rhypophila sp. PSN 637]